MKPCNFTVGQRVKILYPREVHKPYMWRDHYGVIQEIIPRYSTSELKNPIIIVQLDNGIIGGFDTPTDLQDWFTSVCEEALES